MAYRQQVIYQQRPRREVTVGWPRIRTSMPVARGRVIASWRAQWGLEKDIDFAWAFDSFAGAVAYGGHIVANA